MVVSSVSLFGTASGVAIAAIVACLGTPLGSRVLLAQTPRVTPPPPCRAAPADTSLLNLVRASARRGFTSVAVLEFDSRVMELSRAHLAPAITAQLRSRLATVAGVAVESRGTVERVFLASAGRVDSLLSILGDRYAVVGDVIPQRDRIDVTVRIIESGQSAPRWERVFAYPRTPVRQIEDAVATAVAELAKTAATPQRLSITPAAYEIVLRGDYFLAGHDAGSADSARRTYERAFQMDKSAALSAARAARARAAYLDRIGPVDSRVVGEQVLAGLSMVDAALRLDPKLAEAWTARAMLLRYRNPGTYAGVVAAHERAVALAPASADAHDAYGVTLMRLGRDAAADQHLRRALVLEPNRASALLALAELEFVRRRFASSCALSNASIGADAYEPSAYALRARVRMRLAEFRDAFSDAETAKRLSDLPWGDALQLLVTANATTVDDARLEARRVAATRLRPGLTMSVAEGTYVSMAFEALGDRDKAFEALRRVTPRGVELTNALRDVGFDGMRTDGRFRRMVLADDRAGKLGRESMTDDSTMKRLVGSVPP
jgi:tetratricopeptide (TPR) repeat protein